MKLQKQLSRRVGNIDYPKYLIVIPTKVIKDMGWKQGLDLDFEIKDKRLVLKPKV